MSNGIGIIETATLYFGAGIFWLNHTFGIKDPFCAQLMNLCIKKTRTFSIHNYFKNALILKTFFVASGGNVYQDVAERGTLADIGVKSPNIEGSCGSRKARVSGLGKILYLK